MPTQTLIPSQAPINLTKWLEQQQMTAPIIKAAFRNTNRNPIFQDDQDQKQQTKLVRNALDQLFSERIEPADEDAKFADV
ncbi:unnamed protein product [Rotaria magnacalcarata]|uniref:Uncharacterized protein n=1 Tax=Rotaria magnacalcarata TaxID=392030 RepID=A0A820MNM6_9BILA|nr:unnamed protein product [Rotaria magnacalcarata]CAF4324815.1 unnamed protein product [Rotaria magnacalcarata]CAF4375380.1 unnamed protein product [Rotaria magnacalcarata]